MLNNFLFLISSLQKRIVNSVLKFFLNGHMRRIVLISSLHAQIKGVKQPDSDILEKLSDVMSFGLKYKEAPEIAMYVSGRIWHNPINISCHSGVCFEIKDLKDINKINLNYTQMRIVSDQILKSIPEWLKYDSNRNMKRDVMKLLVNLQAI